MKREVSLSLAMVRNNLYSGRFGEPDQRTLEEVASKIQGSNGPFRQLMLNVINNARDDIAKNRFREAGHELNAIHNLPVEAEDFSSWDEEWFYAGEVPDYIERIGQNARSEEFLRMLNDAKALYEKAL